MLSKTVPHLLPRGHATPPASLLTETFGPEATSRLAQASGFFEGATGSPRGGVALANVREVLAANPRLARVHTQVVGPTL